MRESLAQTAIKRAVIVWRPTLITSLIAQKIMEFVLKVHAFRAILEELVRISVQLHAKTMQMASMCVTLVQLCVLTGAILVIMETIAMAYVAQRANIRIV